MNKHFRHDWRKSMYGLMRKDGLYFAATLLLSLGFTLYLIRLSGMNAASAVFLGSVGPAMILSVLGMVELRENQSNGYRFLAALPLTDTEIVGAKFLLILVFTCLYTGGELAILTLFPGAATLTPLARGYIVLTANGSLILAAIVYLGLYRFGFSRFFRFILTVLPIPVMMGPVVLFLILAPRIADWDPSPWMRLGTVTTLGIISFFGLALYTAIFPAAVRAKKNHPGD